MSEVDALRRGRAAFRTHAWKDACGQLSAAGKVAPLGAGDLELLAISAYLTGNDATSRDAWVRAHNEYVRERDLRRAARCAFWMILELLSTGEWIGAAGWSATAQRLLDEDDRECAERGLLLVLAARRHLKEGNVPAAHEAANRAAALGERCDDPDLKAFGRLVQGQVRTRTGDAAGAAALFDEIMIAVTLGGISPIAIGTIYCAVIEACHQIADVERARAWTAALSHWCASQPDLVPFRGSCLVHRAETMRLSGAWSGALQEARHVCGVSESTGQPDERSSALVAAPAHVVGAAFYETAEIYRMRGQFREAEEAYRQASEHGRPPEPGFALLRLAQGRIKSAATALRRVLDQRQQRMARAIVLAACVEVMIAARDLTTARAAADELSAIAGSVNAPFLRGLSAHAAGTLLFAGNDPRAAFSALRDAWMEWQAIEAPYEAARARLMMGLACQRLGDEEAAQMEFDAARRVFVQLEAAPDVTRVNELLSSPAAPASGALTPRELQVIRLVAAGRTNRAIARELTISERTVDRHVSNILTKLNLSSRSAATAYAYEHGLV